ncbi:hypothetical protein S83_041991, partial [Arachis hypogaea]
VINLLWPARSDAKTNISITAPSRAVRVPSSYSLPNIPALQELTSQGEVRSRDFRQKSTAKLNRKGEGLTDECLFLAFQKSAL